MPPKPISDDTRARILTAAWDLIAGQGRADVGQAEIAAAAGVSRQTVFYAFGNRAGLLQAMVAHHDATSDRLAALREVSRSAPPTIDGLFAVIERWLDYLPEVYPVAVLLDAAALTDPDARVAIEDRMVGVLLAGLRARTRAMVEADSLPEGCDSVALAQAIWELVHVHGWRRLVADCGWSAEAFRANRLALVRALLSRA